MVKHKMMPIPHASIGEVLGLLEVIYSYGSQAKISFLNEELRLPIDQLGDILDMAELFDLVKIKEGVASLTIYGEALSLGTIDDKKRMLRRKIPSVEPFKTAITIMKKKGQIKEAEMFSKLKEKFTIEDKTAFHKLFIGWGTYTDIFEYDGEEGLFKTPEPEPPKNI
ncbi:AAA-associated domain-containing protein [Candidatus Micrarchaeota archaeon]|nr:AAA-associated domain-containing protein [Candidatus Micrarchaeota archaeon]